MQYPIHFWFIHDLRLLKRSLIALASQVPEEVQECDENGYRPLPDKVSKELATLPNKFLKACGYEWHNDTPRKLEFLRDCRKDGLTRQHVSKLHKIPEFAIRMPPALKKIRKKAVIIFAIVCGIAFIPILVPAMAIMGIFIVLGKSKPYLVRAFHCALSKALPENLPDSKVLGTEKPSKKLPSPVEPESISSSYIRAWMDLLV